MEGRARIKEEIMTPKETADKIVKIMDDKKAENILMLAITDLTILADYFCICTATSTTHIKALSDEIEFRLKREDVAPHHVEGYMSGNWVLLDYGSVIVHLFTQETREFYSLEKLWADAKKIGPEAGAR